MTSSETAGRQRLLDALSAVWQEIRGRHPEVPEVLVTWSAGGRAAKSVPQHLHTGTWSGELTITDEQATAEPDVLVGMLLHDAAHGLAAARNVAETSRGGRYHNGRYKPLAVELGLDVVSDDPTWGWSETTPTAETAEAYRACAAVEQLRAALRERPGGTRPEPAGARGSGQISADCGCTGAAARPLRMSAAKFALGPITCGVCGQPYVERAGRAG